MNIAGIKVVLITEIDLVEWKWNLKVKDDNEKTLFFCLSKLGAHDGVKLGVTLAHVDDYVEILRTKVIK